MKEAMLYDKISEDKVHCFLCAHHCKINTGQYGICGVRRNIGGKLYTYAYGKTVANHVDPIEKKPLFHFIPGTLSYSIATIGCNFQCGFCQNWQISQTSQREGKQNTTELDPDQIVNEALVNKCKSISYTYTEPTIFFEYAYDTAKIAKKKGLKNIFVTNGYMTKECLQAIHPFLDACNVDLKSFRNNYYKKNCKSKMEPVLDSIRTMKELGLWIEITTLVIPGQNDSLDEFNDIANFIKELDENIPWHVSRFHPDHLFTGYESTPIETLKTAKQIGKQNGLKYIYIGNVIGDTQVHCHSCNNLLIKRTVYNVVENNIKGGKCLSCGAKIPGVWN